MSTLEKLSAGSERLANGFASFAPQGDGARMISLADLV